MGAPLAKSAPGAAEAAGGEDLWSAVRGGDAEARRRLVEAHEPLVRRLAAQLFARRPDGIADFGDYLHYGMVGLLEAVERYDPARGASFATFARYRVRGAILNGTAKVSEQREFHSHRARLRSERLKSIREDGPEPSDDAFRELVEVTIGISLGVLLETAARDERIAHAERANPYARCALAEVRSTLTRRVGGLPERERFVIRQHYFHHTSFAEIAGVLGVTKGRVSQLHGRALRRIREAYQASRPLDDYY